MYGKRGSADGSPLYSVDTARKADLVAGGKTYADLEIRILEKQDRGYPVEITFNGDQEFPRGFLDCSAQPSLNLHRPDECGKQLFSWLVSAPELHTAWAQTRGRHPLRRIRLRIDATAPELHAVPWELLQDAGDGIEPQTLAAMEATPFSRYLAGPWIPGAPIVKRPIRILVAVADPENLEEFNLSRIDFDREWELIRDAVKDAGGEVEAVRLAPPCTLQSLESELRNGYHILYLVAHGQYFREQGQCVLYLAREDNRVVPVKDRDFTSMLARQFLNAGLRQDSTLRLVHLSSCQTAVRSPANAFRGLAPQLVAAGVPAVIAMQDTVSVTAAQGFSRIFYQELLEHGEVDRAGNAARSSLLTGGIHGAAIPVLFMRLRFGQLFANRRSGVFLAYNPADAPVVEELAARLNDAGVRPWFDKWNLAPGDNWEKPLDGALDEASACAVLMGPAGLAPWQNEQVRIAVDRSARNESGNLRIVPVLLPGARREQRSKLPTYVVSTTWVEFGDSIDNDAAFYRLLCGVRGQEPGAVPVESVTVAGNPYRGLECFDLEHSDMFFGREALVEWLLAALRAPAAAVENRFLCLIGPSGSGKSSLARAGLMAAIRQGKLRGSSDWPIAIFKPGAQPLESLAIALAPLTGCERTPAAIRAQADEMRHSERSLTLSVSLSLSATPSRRCVILADQFEEVFTQCTDETVRRALIDNLMVAANDPGGQTIVVLTVRADLYGECSAYPVLAASMSDHQVLVGPMEKAELRRAIERPALMCGAEFERGLVDALLGEVCDQPGSLPLLEDTLLDLWQRREGRKLTHAAYQEIGKVTGALERRAEEVYASLAEPERVILKRIFLRLVQSIEGGVLARRRTTKKELVPATADRKLVDDLIARLAGPGARLLTIQVQGAVDHVDIAHEALIQSWPRLKRWLSEDQEFQFWLKRLNAARQAWESKDRDPNALLRGALLEEAEAWLRSRGADLNDAEREFIDGGVQVRKLEAEERAHKEREFRAEQERRLVAEMERSHSEAARAEIQARSARRFRKLTAVLAASLCLAVGAAGFANYHRRIAERERNLSNSLALAKTSETIAHPDLRVLVALHAMALAHTRQTEEALYLAALAFRGPRFRHAPLVSRVMNLAASADGRHLVSADALDTVTLWAAREGVFIGLTKFEDGVAGIAFESDASLLVATAKGAVDGFDILAGVRKRRMEVPGEEFKSLAVAPDGRLFAAGSLSGRVFVGRRGSDRNEPLTGHSAAVQAAAFSRDGSLLVTVDGAGTAIGWKIESRQPAFRMTTDAKMPLSAVAVAPMGEFMATGDSVGTLRIYQAPYQTPIDQQQHAEMKSVSAIAWTADGRTLLSAADDGQLKFWDVSPAGKLHERVAVPCGRATPDPIEANSRCTAMAFLADKRLVAVGTSNGAIYRYQTDFGLLFEEMRTAINLEQINAADCMRYLGQQKCEAPQSYDVASR